MVRLIAKMETSVIDPSTDSNANVPMIAKVPMSSGSNAATTEPKTISSRIRVTGMAMDSAIANDLVTWVLMSPNTPAGPPALTVSPLCSPEYLSAISPPRVTMVP